MAGKKVTVTSDRPKTKTSAFTSLYKKRSLNEWLSNTSNMKEGLEVRSKNLKYHKLFRVPRGETVYKGIQRIKFWGVKINRCGVLFGNQFKDYGKCGKCTRETVCVPAFCMFSCSS